jgi:glutamine cyclotransferase
MRKSQFMRVIIFICSLVILGLASCGDAKVTPNKSANNTNSAVNATRAQASLPVYGYEIVNTYPHDPKAFTEGLFFHDGFLFESTGEQKRSSLRRVDVKTGKIEQKFDMDPELFGEGTTVFKDKIYQLTWRDKIAFTYDLKTFKMLQEFDYPDDGWGMTHDDTHLIVSNGTHVLKFLDPETLKTEKTLPVFREDGSPLMSINELEYIRGEIWANIWHSEKPDILGKPNRIARINPSNGKLIGWIDLANISPDDTKRDDENTLNGIAYDASDDRIFVTGKNWKKLFEIKVIPPQ